MFSITVTVIELFFSLKFFTHSFIQFFSRLELQFKKEFDSNHNVGYDYTSVMQYPSWAFSISVLERNTIAVNITKPEVKF